MAWGVLEDRRTPRPPGTVPLESKNGASDIESAEEKDLKRRGNTILQPQPTDSPEDPLNWSQKRKYSIFSVIVIAVIATVGISNMLNTGYQILAVDFGINFPTLVKALTPPVYVSVLVGLFLASAIAAVWGKRVQFVGASIIMLFTLLSGCFANSLVYYQIISVFNGLCTAPLELLAAPVTAEMVYVHERGTLSAVASVVAVLGQDISHIISGNIIRYLGVKYTFVISLAAWVPIAVLIYFFFYETTFDRTAYRAKQESQRKAANLPLNHVKDSDVDVNTVARSTTTTKSLERREEPKPSRWEELRIFRGRLTDRSFIKSLIQPFPLMLFPSVIFCSIVYGAFSTWTLVMSNINLLVLAYPPYSLPSNQLAYASLPGSAISFVASVVSGLTSDWLIKFLSRRNGGMYEPEFRLLMMAPAVLFSTLGFWLSGYAYAAQASVVRIVGTSLLVNAGAPFASSAAFMYIFDTQQKSSTEAIVATALYKVVFGFCALQFVPTWYVKVGPVKVFTALAVLNLGVSALTVPMYVFGKRIRGAVARNKWLMQFMVAD